MNIERWENIVAQKKAEGYTTIGVRLDDLQKFVDECKKVKDYKEFIAWAAEYGDGCMVEMIETAQQLCAKEDF